MRTPSIIKCQQLRIPAMAVCAVLSLGPAGALAQVHVGPVYVAESGNDLGFYLTGDLGPSFMPNFQSSRFGFPGSFSPDVGVRLTAEPGYNFLATSRLTLGGEFETGVIYNQLSPVSEGASFRRGDYYQVPLLGNLVLKLHPDAFVVPYVGVGGGGDYSWARVRAPGYSGYSTRSEEVDPAVQGMAGVRFQLDPNWDAGLGYKILAAFPGQGSSITTHAVIATVTLRF